MNKKIIVVITLVAIVILIAFILNKDKGNTTTTQIEDIEDITGIGDTSVVHGIELSVVQVDQANNTIVYKIKSNTETLYSYGEATRLEQMIDGSWEEVIPIEEMAVATIAYILKKDDENSHTMYIGNYNTLEKGSYRVVKRIMLDEIAGNRESDFNIYGTFEVK